MHQAARWLTIAWLIAGCAGSRGEMGSSESALTLALRVDARAATGSQPRVLKPLEPLHSGDKIALEIDVDRPASVYVAHERPGGKLALLFSPNGEQKVMPGQPLRVPSQGQWLEPDGQAAEENLVVVASMQPFNQLELDLCQSLKRSSCSLVEDSPAGMRGVEADAPPPPPSPPPSRDPPPPPPLDISKRGPGGQGYDRRARSDGKGVAVLRLVLRHQR